MTPLELEAILPGNSNTLSQFDIEVLLPELKKLTKKDWYVEIGVLKGRSLYLASLKSQAKLYGVDVEDFITDERFDLVSHCTLDTRGSDEVSVGWTKPISMLFIDGDHTYAGVKKDWENWAKFVKPGGIVFFHDCDESSPGVAKLFRQIKKDPEFTDFTLYKKRKFNTSMASCRRKV